MGEPTNSFFDRLSGAGRQPLLAQATGTLRFELKDGGKTQRWLVSVDKGEITVSRARRKADCVIRADKALFEGIARGEVNATAAALRGAIEVEGDPRLLTLFQRLLPGPPAKSRAAR
jgi:putative sterol carrier protein